jgi:hypothetical protein
LFRCSNNLRETGNDGEPVNISNIEKKVREFENVSDKFKNYDKYGNQIKRELEK